MKQFMVDICQPCEEQTTPDQKAQDPIAQEEEPDEEPKQKKINLRKFAK